MQRRLRHAPRSKSVVNNVVGGVVVTRGKGFPGEFLQRLISFFCKVISNNDCAMRIVDVERCFAEVFQKEPCINHKEPYITLKMRPTDTFSALSHAKKGLYHV